MSLVWLKEKQRGNHFMTPAWPIKDAEGLGGGQEGRSRCGGSPAALPQELQTVSAGKIYASQFQVLL